MKEKVYTIGKSGKLILNVRSTLLCDECSILCNIERHEECAARGRHVMNQPGRNSLRRSSYQWPSATCALEWHNAQRTDSAARQQQYQCCLCMHPPSGISNHLRWLVRGKVMFNCITLVKYNVSSLRPDYF